MATAGTDLIFFFSRTVCTGSKMTDGTGLPGALLEPQHWGPNYGKDLFSKYKDSHCKRRTMVRPSDLYNRYPSCPYIEYNYKIRNLYWNSTLVFPIPIILSIHQGLNDQYYYESKCNAGFYATVVLDEVIPDQALPQTKKWVCETCCRLGLELSWTQDLADDSAQDQGGLPITQWTGLDIKVCPHARGT